MINVNQKKPKKNIKAFVRTLRFRAASSPHQPVAFLRRRRFGFAAARGSTGSGATGTAAAAEATSILEHSGIDHCHTGRRSDDGRACGGFQGGGEARTFPGRLTEYTPLALAWAPVDQPWSQQEQLSVAAAKVDNGSVLAAGSVRVTVGSWIGMLCVDGTGLPLDRHVARDSRISKQNGPNWLGTGLLRKGTDEA